MLNITVSSATQKLLEQRLTTGEFGSADELLHAALEALDWVSAIKLDESTLDAIDRGEDQINRGQVHEWSDLREQVRAEFLGK